MSGDELAYNLQFLMRVTSEGTDEYSIKEEIN
jgi:hypothetical protein